MHKYSILIADDDAMARLRLTHFLNQFGYNVVVCEDGEEAWQRINQPDAPQLLLLDWMMPGMDGVDICRRLRQQEGEHGGYHYTLLLTSRDDSEDVVEGLESGADDYLIKPFKKAELQVRLRAGRRILELQQQLMDARNHFEREAKIDPLTGVNNRGAIEQLVHSELDRAQREHKSLAIAMIDIDFFKKVNDNYGHLAGDEVLRETVRRLKKELRIYDHIGRYGGEEFLLALPGDGQDDALQLAERLRKSVEIAPVDSPAGIVPVTVSIGVCVVAADFEGNQNQVINQADQMLYKAKESGRNRVKITAID